jgi:hypothetical protein
MSPLGLGSYREGGHPLFAWMTLDDSERFHRSNRQSRDSRPPACSVIAVCSRLPASKNTAMLGIYIALQCDVRLTESKVSF